MKTITTSLVVTTLSILIGEKTASVGLKKQPRIRTASIGPMLESATRPKLSLAEFLSLLIEARPTPIAMMNGTVIGPVVTPPESNATEIKSLGMKNEMPISIV